MAGSLAEALAGVLLKPQDTGWGVGLTTLQAVAPRLMSPYASTGQNLGYGIGGALLAGLIGGMARRSADAENQKLFAATQQLYGSNPSQRAALVEEHPRLTSLAAALAGVEQERAQELAQKQAEKAIDFGYKLKEEEAMMPFFERKEGIKAGLDLDKARAMIPLEVGKATAIEQAKLTAERDMARGGLTPKEAASLETDFTKQLTSGAQAQELIDLTAAGNDIASALENSTPLAATTAIYRYAKVLDPAGAVRGEDGRMIADPGGPLGALAVLHNKIMQEGILTDKAKSELRRLVPALAKNKFEAYKMQADVLRENARVRGANPDFVGMLPEPNIMFRTVAPNGQIVEIVK